MIGQDPLDLNGQIAFVTGAGQGAGRAIALALARHNAGGVAVNDFVPERAEAVCKEIEALGVKAFPAAADVSDYDGLKRTMESAAEALGGPITLLVNNAGNAGPTDAIGASPPFWEAPTDDWGKFFKTNLYGVMNCCHILVPGMIKAGRGRIVTVVSDAGRVGENRLTAYSAAKGGATSFIRALARETGRYGITSNAISLSTLEPPLEEPQKSEFLASEQAKAHVSRYVIRRFGKPDDVAHMALFLCSDASSWITGQTYPVNGGYYFSG